MPPGAKKRKAAKKKKEMEEQRQKETTTTTLAVDHSILVPYQGNGHHQTNHNNSNDNSHLLPHGDDGKDSEGRPLPPLQPSQKSHLLRSQSDQEGEGPGVEVEAKEKRMERSDNGRMNVEVNGETVAAREEVKDEAAPVGEESVVKLGDDLTVELDKSEGVQVPSEAEDQKEMKTEKPAVEESVDVPVEQQIVDAPDEVRQEVDEVPSYILEEVIQKGAEVPVEVVEELRQDGDNGAAEVVVEASQKGDEVLAEVAVEAAEEGKEVPADVSEEASLDIVPLPSREREVKVVPLADADDEVVEKPVETYRVNHEDEGADTSVATEVAPCAPLLVKRTTWWNCCGLLDVFAGSDR